MSSTRPSAGNPQVRRLIVLVAVLVLVAALIFEVYKATRPPRGGDPHNDIPALKATRYYDFVGAQHTTDPVHYRQVPPAGGPHDPTWDDCGVYQAPPRNENAVHDLEHGTVWITYRPGLDSAGIQKLESALGAVKTGKIMLSPYPGLPAPVVVTVWDAQLDLNGPDDPRLPTFIGFYGDGHTAPEAAFATCKGGAHVMASPSNP
ncbi:MAG TPA: DUF3105 domain-containing protein [Nocardioides sp.]|uniref:DUF3105 domain-containing protein n=1 Tax=Nocardioides sp. TaxID=35761 RepID=UPI002E3259B9|nr:DUF3105 domain-containing protein [Nocardioides sp.]HEX3931546.1 DUF3105 domain-containing protein [Nocardioides sp.]